MPFARLQQYSAAATCRPQIPRRSCGTNCMWSQLSGVYTISALIGDQHMSGSLAEVEASTAQAHAPHCEVVGAPLTLHTTAGAWGCGVIHFG